MGNSTLIRRGSEMLAALIIALSTIFFLSAHDQYHSFTTHLTGNMRVDGVHTKDAGHQDINTINGEMELFEAGAVAYINEGIADQITEEYYELPEEAVTEVQAVQAVVEAVPAYRYVQISSLNIRKGPGSDTEKLGTLSLGTEVQVLEEQGEWVKILMSDNQQAYVFAEYLADTRPPVYHFVNVNLLNVRRGPGSDTEKISELTKGTRIQILEKQGDWTKVILKDGLEGFVFTEYLVANEPLVSRAAGTQSHNASLSASIIEYAKQFTGVPYVYGGSSPKGFDCSGFTQYVFKQFKISVPRSAEEYANFGTKISRSELKPGDILLFDRYNNYRLGHVGIYIGGDQFIHASSSLKKVVIASLSNYRGNYMGARRVIK